MTINTPSLEDVWLILYSESLFSLETMFLCFRLTFINRYFQCIRLTMWHHPRGSFKLYKENIIGISDQFQDSTKCGSIKHYFSQLLSWSAYYTYNMPYLIIRSIFLVFAIYRSIFFHLNSLSCVQKALKNIQTKFQIGCYWSFKYMSNYQLNVTYLE